MIVDFIAVALQSKAPRSQSAGLGISRFAEIVSISFQFWNDWLVNCSVMFKCSQLIVIVDFIAVESQKLLGQSLRD